VAHTALVTRAELPRFGVPTDFLSQFDKRPIEVSVYTAGALGTAAFKWRRLGESSWSAAVTTSTDSLNPMESVSHPRPRPCHLKTCRSTQMANRYQS
jgi:hypothetical protein